MNTMRTIEVKGYKQGDEFFMTVTRFDGSGKAITTTDKAGVDSVSELNNVMNEYQRIMRHYGTRVVILKGDK